MYGCKLLEFSGLDIFLRLIVLLTNPVIAYSKLQKDIMCRDIRKKVLTNIRR